MRVCIIGAGPSGLSFLHHVHQLRSHTKENLVIQCYEKQKDWGGLWNLDWRVGVDEKGDAVHGSMYKYLWSNGPKEASLEFPDYTFDEHFKTSISSFPPRAVILDYLEGRWTQNPLRSYITFSHSVLRVTFERKTSTFILNVKNREENVELEPLVFDYVINASGHFSTPYTPTFKGIETFGGRILHSHDFRDAREFKGKDLLIVGSSYSAEDLSLQVIKYGAKSVIISYNNKRMGYKWPTCITERPHVYSISSENLITFSDESTAIVDVIIFATGYLHHYPWMEESLRLKAPNTLYPPNLYKGTLWLTEGANRLFYLGAQDQYYTFTMFDAQAYWAVQVISGAIKLPSYSEMVENTMYWISKCKALSHDSDKEIDFQSDFVNDLIKDADYKYKDLNCGSLFKEWKKNKYDNILTYRDQVAYSIFTHKVSPLHHTPWMKAFDDSLESFLNKK